MTTRRFRIGSTGCFQPAVPVARPCAPRRHRARCAGHGRADVTKTTQIIAIYGKGGIGKSFTLANLSYMMAQQGKKVLLIGCDPKSDTTSLLFGGKACPTIIETSSKKKLAGEAVAIGDVCFKRDGVYAMELGGPEVGRGCGGRGIIHGFETLEKLGFHDWGFDYVLLDFLGDVVCGGFGLPIARDMCQKVIVVAQQRPAIALRRQQRLLRGRVLPQARRQCRRGRHGDQQGTTVPVRLPPSPPMPASPCWRRSPPTKTSAARARATRSSAGRAPQWALAVRDPGHQCRRTRRRCDPSRRRRTSCSASSVRRGDGTGLPDGAGDCSSTWWASTEVVKPTPRSHLRRGLMVMNSPVAHPAISGVALTPATAVSSGADAGQPQAGAGTDGLGCHAGRDAMRDAARAAGKTLRPWRSTPRDYPLEVGAGPHDQPQSMCPAFGALRVGLRMRRTATILSGSACCVYGLTFTSHFYGAKRSVGYVPFNCESAGDRQVVRGHPRGGACAGRS